MNRRLLFGIFGLLLLIGCGATPLSSRYAAEKRLYRAREVLSQIANKPEAAASLREEAIKDFQAILDNFPLSLAKGDRVESHALGAVRVAAGVHLSNLYRDQKQRKEAIAALRRVRGETKDQPDLALKVHGELISLLSRPLEADSLVDVLRECAEDLSPADADGKPIPLVIEAPLSLVDVLQSVGEETRAKLELENARTYYEDVTRKYAGTETEVVSRIELAKVALRQGRVDDADQFLNEVRGVPAAKPYEGAILFSQGGVRSQKPGSEREAIAAFRELIRRFPDDMNAPQALLQIGAVWNRLGQPDSALAVLAEVSVKYPRDTNAGASARLATAHVQAQTRKWADALRTLRSLVADYPRTSPGLLGPIEIVKCLEESGQKDAVPGALREASQTYERLANDLGSDAANRGLVTQALDHLAEVSEALEDWQKAANALLTRAQNFPDDPRSPLAYVRAAGMLEERLKDRAGAIHTLELLAGRYPDSPLAERAKQKIQELKGSQ